MKKIKVYYAKIGNMGDLLNELIIENVMGYNVMHCTSKFQCQTTGIGSSLGGFFPSKSRQFSIHEQLQRKFLGWMRSPLQVWSTGFIYYPNEEEICLRNRIEIASVRGELTRIRLEKILNKKLNIPTGDGGLLASHLIKGAIQKKYSIGIVPHFREKDELRFKELQENYENSVLIDLTDDPLTVVKTIAQCEFILSSSLHGLIVADSFNIPNKRLVFTDRLLGDGYKFNDYYSSFNVSNSVFDLKNPGCPSVNSIIDDYKVPVVEVEKKKNELITSFSRYL